MAIGIQIGIVSFLDFTAEAFLKTISNVYKDEKIYLFDWYKGPILEKKIANTNIQCVKFTVDMVDSWSDCRNKIEKLYNEYKIDRFFICRNDMLGGFRRNDYKGFESFMSSDNDRYSWTYESIKIKLFKFMFVSVAQTIGVNVYNFSTDSGEPSYSEFMSQLKFQQFYTLNKPDFNNAKYMPFYEYPMMCRAKKLDKEKTNNFMLYCTAFMESRQWMVEQRDVLQNIDGFDIKIFCKGHRNGLPNQTIYYQQLAKNRYSLAVVSNDPTTFSVPRFIECIALDCLCLVHIGCDCSDVSLTFKNIYDIMINELMVEDFDDVKRFIENTSEKKRLQLINDIKTTKEWKAITSPIWIKRRYDKCIK